MTARCKFFNQTRIPVRLTIAKTKTKTIMAHTKTNTLAHTHTLGGLLMARGKEEEMEEV